MGKIIIGCAVLPVLPVLPVVPVLQVQVVQVQVSSLRKSAVFICVNLREFLLIRLHIVLMP